MNKLAQYINSGILEMYVLGQTSPEETKEVTEMAILHESIRDEITEISNAFEIYATDHSKKPSPTVKPFLLAVVDYTERLKSGEQVSFPPLLNENTKVIDFAEWVNRNDMTLPVDFDQFHAKIIGYTPEAVTAISWIKTMAPHEVHHNELERFFVLEGSCEVTIDDKVHHLSAGDFLAIPLYVGHTLIVTSEIPCKVILQRVAA